MLKNLLANWKTTSAGATMIIGSTVHLVFQVRAGSANENTWTLSLTAIVAGMGLIFAGDATATPPSSARPDVPPSGPPVQTKDTWDPNKP